MRRLRGLQEDRRRGAGRGVSRLLLVASAPTVLRHRQGRQRADRQGSARRIAALYEIEKTIRGTSDKERRRVRRERASRWSWPREWLERSLPASPPNRRLPRPSATASTIGTGSSASSTTAASNSTPKDISMRPQAAHQKERSLRRPRRGRRKLGLPRLADRMLHVWMASAVQGFCWRL